MRERDVKRRLRGLTAPGGQHAPEESILRARAELRRARAVEEGKPALARDRRWWAPATLATVLLVLGLSSPARGVAEQIGELVGIGDEPTEAPIFDPPETRTDQIVIGVGSSPTGVAYEVIASRFRERGADGRESICFRVSFPGHDRRGVIQCLTRAAREAFGPATVTPVASTGPRRLPRSERVVVVGIVGPGVESVEVRLGELAVSPAIHRLTPDLGDTLGTDVEAGYFIALLPAQPGGRRAVVEVLPSGTDGSLRREVIAVP